MTKLTPSSVIKRQHFGLDPAVPTAEGRDVIIIGTGDTASDCVATALRQVPVQILVHLRRHGAALGDGPHHQRLPPPHVARSKDLLHVGARKFARENATINRA